MKEENQHVKDTMRRRESLCLVSMAKATGALGQSLPTPQAAASVLMFCKLKFHLAYKAHG